MELNIDRINELYHKSQTMGLTPEEKEEQDRLRRNYVLSIRNNMRNTLNNISIKNPDGSITDLKDRDPDRKKNG